MSFRGGPQCEHPRRLGQGGHLWTFWQWRHKQILQGVIRGQVRNLKSLKASGASHRDSDSPECLSVPRSGHRTKLFLYWFLSCPILSPPHPKLASCRQRAMHLGRAGSLGPQATVKALEAVGGPPRCEVSPGYKSLAWAWTQSQQTHLVVHRGGEWWVERMFEERPQTASRPW